MTLEEKKEKTLKMIDILESHLGDPFWKTLEVLIIDDKVEVDVVPHENNEFIIEVRVKFKR